MHYQEFITPDDQEIIEAIGVEPQTEDDGDARSVTVTDERDGDLTISYYSHGRSLRVRWMHEDRTLLDIFREDATRMSVHSESQSTYFLIEFRVTELAGVMKVQIFPQFSVTDKQLFI